MTETEKTDEETERPGGPIWVDPMALGNADGGLDRLGIDFDLAEDIVERSREGRTRGNRDMRICICGHPAWAHTELSEGHWCKPSRAECPCENLLPVAVTSDTRIFKWKTIGRSGEEHALSLGMAAARLRGDYLSFEGPLVKAGCWVCKKENVPVTPRAINRRGKVSGEPEARNGLLCAECAEKLS